MSCPNQLPAKDPEAKTVLTFDFSTQLGTGETLSTFVAREITVIAGVDPNPAAMWNGAQTTNTGNTSVSQPIQGGLDGCYYQLKMIFNTNVTNRTLVSTLVLPISSS
jgi:hypothetical protein